jgi:hypothetical protein
MSIHVWHDERRDDADREASGKQALALTQAIRAADRVRSSRFYWSNADTVGVQSVAEDGLSDAPPTAEAARAMFALSDLARQTRSQQWVNPGTGERTYRDAGR